MKHMGKELGDNEISEAQTEEEENGMTSARPSKQGTMALHSKFLHSSVASSAPPEPVGNATYFNEDLQFSELDQKSVIKSQDSKKAPARFQSKEDQIVEEDLQKKQQYIHDFKKDLTIRYARKEPFKNKNTIPEPKHH